ncbi:MAG: hypothetical protein EBU40_16385, partial [Proteobacteria bacterium]|nr:hypothetical protein [Pseudomonadota bacterium]
RICCLLNHALATISMAMAKPVIQSRRLSSKVLFLFHRMVLRLEPLAILLSLRRLLVPTPLIPVLQLKWVIQLAY